MQRLIVAKKELRSLISDLLLSSAHTPEEKDALDYVEAALALIKKAELELVKAPLSGDTKLRRMG
jgi:hypothetical protein